MTRLIGQVLARVLRCRRWLRSGLWGRYDLSIWANGRWGIEDRRVGVGAHGAERLGFRRDSIISDRFARREIRPLGHCLGLSHQTRASLARSRIHPQNAEHHRRPGENQGGIPLCRRYPTDRIDTAFADDFVAFRCWIRSAEPTSEL